MAAAPNKPMRVAIHRFFGWGPKVDLTVDEVLEGARSYSTLYPVSISRLDKPLGGVYILDGYHRVVEAILRGDPFVVSILDRYVPRIERTGGAFRTALDAKVNLRRYLPRLWRREAYDRKRE